MVPGVGAFTTAVFVADRLADARARPDALPAVDAAPVAGADGNVPADTLAEPGAVDAPPLDDEQPASAVTATAAAPTAHSSRRLDLAVVLTAGLNFPDVSAAAIRLMSAPLRGKTRPTAL